MERLLSFEMLFSAEPSDSNGIPVSKVFRITFNLLENYISIAVHELHPNCYAAKVGYNHWIATNKGGSFRILHVPWSIQENYLNLMPLTLAAYGSLVHSLETHQAILRSICADDA